MNEKKTLLFYQKKIIDANRMNSLKVGISNYGKRDFFIHDYVIGGNIGNDARKLNQVFKLNYVN